MNNTFIYLLPTFKPSRADKAAADIAGVIVAEGMIKASEAFNAFCKEHKFLDYDAVMLRDLVLYHLHRLQPDHPDIPKGYTGSPTRPLRPTFVGG